jgi:hypothetical protein
MPWPPLKNPGAIRLLKKPIPAVRFRGPEVPIRKEVDIGSGLFTLAFFAMALGGFYMMQQPVPRPPDYYWIKEVKP